MNSRVKKLFNNSITFALGNFGSRVISIVMVPFYTYILTTSEYGQVDLYLTIVSLLIPIATLSIPDAVLRFVLDEDEDKNEIVSNSFFVMTIGFFIFFIVSAYMSKYINFPRTIIYIIILQGVQLFLAQYARGIGLIKQYAYNGILMAVVLAVSNLILMKHFEMGVEGYLLSVILTNCVSISFLLFFTGYKSFFSVKNISKKTIKMLLVYSIPLIPNGIMWWILNASSRFFILNDLGVEYNGIFAVSNKIPSLLLIFQTIFFQAWQLSAIEESKSEDSNKYNSTAYLYFSKFMFLMTLLLIVTSRFVVELFVSNQFSDAWKFIPFLLLGVLYSSFASFIGTQYLVLKKTTGVFVSSILGAFVNVLFCLILIPVIGLQGASIALFLGFFSVYIFRLYNIKKISEFEISFKSEIVNLCTVLIATQLILIKNPFVVIFLFIILLAIYTIFNKEVVKLIKKIFILMKRSVV